MQDDLRQRSVRGRLERNATGRRARAPRPKGSRWVGGGNPVLRGMVLAMAMAMAMALGPVAAEGRIVTDFAEGSGESHWNQFPGDAGGGWDGSWGRFNRDEGDDKPADELVLFHEPKLGRGEPFGDDSRHLNVRVWRDAPESGVGGSATGLRRSYARWPTHGIDRAEPHIIHMRLRLDRVTITESSDVFGIFAFRTSSSRGMRRDTRTSWAMELVPAPDADSEDAGALQWRILDGDGEGEFKRLELDAAQISGAEGTTYDIRIEIDPPANRWDAVISDGDNELRVSDYNEGEPLGFLGNHERTGRYINFTHDFRRTGGQRDLHFSLDHVSIEPADTAPAEEPVALFLTWQQDPTTTMTIDWHTAEPPDESPPSVVRYKAKGADQWREAAGNTHEFPFSDRTIHRVELADLEPATTYRFRAGEFERIYKFRTMPTQVDEPLRFAVGGDNSIGQAFRDLNRLAMQFDPEFIVWGGDLAYANGDPRRLYRWYEWFDIIRETLISPEGRVVPILVAIGNHEIFSINRLVNSGEAEDHDEAAALAQERWGLEHRQATFFFPLFAMPPGPPSYGVVDFADYMTILLLDSNHHTPVEGEQTQWLADQLERRGDVPHLFPVYHVPAYPSVRRYSAETNEQIREHWLPLFEGANVRVAFEHHDHAYKRTYPMRGGEISPSDGIVYIGDGAWGVGARPPGGRGAPDWYLKRAEASQHFIITTLHGPHQHYLMVDIDGKVIDEYPRTPATPQRITVEEPVPDVVAHRLGDGAQRSDTIPLPIEGWRFRLDPDDRGIDDRWFAQDLDTSDWDTIAIDQPWQEAGYNYVGPAWYRLTLELPDGATPDAALLAVGAVDEQAWVYVNGELVGEHTTDSEGLPVGRLWDRAFAIDVSDHLRWGEPNQITIRAKNTAAQGGVHRPIDLELYQARDDR